MKIDGNELISVLFENDEETGSGLKIF